MNIINEKKLIRKISKLKVLVIGDLMLDFYQEGKSTRLSPEAPVPVVELMKEKFEAGGAANVAINLSKMGANVTCIGYVGDDLWGKKLTKILKNYKVNTRNIDIIKNHITTVKQRIISNSNQVVRVDHEKVLKTWKPRINIKYENYDIIILSDYNKGVFKNNWFKNNGNIVVLDPKKSNNHLFKNSSIITPNLDELSILSGIKNIVNNNLVHKASKILIEKYGFEYVIAKKGRKGISVINNQFNIENIKPIKINNPDVTGAGDTVIAIFSLFYVITKNVRKSAFIANCSAAMVVNKKGTVACSLNELINFSINNKINLSISL